MRGISLRIETLVFCAGSTALLTTDKVGVVVSLGYHQSEKIIFMRQISPKPFA